METPYTFQKLDIKAGKRYVTRNGLITSPIRKGNNGTNYIWAAEIQEAEYPDLTVESWLEGGKSLVYLFEHKHDLIAEFPPAPIEDPSCGPLWNK